jgi:uridine kinase
MEKVNLKKIGVWFLTRILMVVIFSATIQRDLFDPFLSNPNMNVLNPWGSWLDSAGRTDAFPYGFAMYLCFLPAIFIQRILAGIPVSVDLEVLIIVTLVLIEFLVYKSIKVFDSNVRGYWSWVAIFSPLITYITYVHGQIDLIPSALFVFSSMYFMRHSWFKAGLFFGLSIAAKFSFVLAGPFFIIFFLAYKSRRGASFDFIAGLTPGISLLFLPAIFSEGYRVMVLSTPEVLKSLDAGVDIGISILYLVPIAYLLVVLGFWNKNYTSSFMLISYVAAAFTVVALTQTSSVGWFYWGIPLALITLREASSRTLSLFFMWQLTVSGYFLLKDPQISTRFGDEIQFDISGIEYLDGLLFTLNIVVGSALVLKILQEGQKLGDIYSLSKKPLTINVAGDSGVGKDTLSNEIARLFGDKEVALLLGDDYHLHERGDSSWLTTTHLSIDANDLEGMGRDFRKLLRDEKVFVKHYDHSVGRFTLPRRIDSSQVVIVNGLHANMIPGSELADLKIFLSMEDDLRIQLKLERDFIQRKHGDENAIRKSIELRLPHYTKFVLPQVGFSDLHFHLRRISSSPLMLGVAVSSFDSALLYEIKRLFNAVSGVPVILRKDDDLTTLEIDPVQFKGPDALSILKQHAVSSDQLFSSDPKFSDGSVGVLSLIVIMALVRKRINYV